MNGRMIMLDGLRGVAALAVLLFHFGLIARPVIVPAGYLAVDFFFILSGFVICQAYEGRMLAGLSLNGFLLQRAVRLWPVVLLGAGLGMLYLCTGWALKDRSTEGIIAILTTGALNALLIPKPLGLLGPDPALFPGNWALWSLFFEALINLVWAVWLAGRPNRNLLIFTGLSALALFSVWLNLSTLNLGFTWPTFAGGLARVSFGFSAGCLIFRNRSRIPGWVARYSWLSLPLLILALVTPIYIPTQELLIVFLILPIVVILGVSSNPNIFRKTYSTVGFFSYALYGIHLPIITLIGGLLRAISPRLIETSWPYAVTPFLIFLAWATAKYYEPRGRDWLGRLAAIRRLD